MKYKVNLYEGYVDLDDPEYDGPEVNINDEEGIYHIEASSKGEAMHIAMDLDEILNIGSYLEPSEAEFM